MVLLKSIFSVLVTLATVTSSYASAVDKAEADINQNGVVASFTFTPDSQGVKVNIDVKSGLKSNDQYMYHIHEKPISADNNCTSAGGHLNPAKVGTVGTYQCNPTNLTSCEVGDLSGKWGTLNSTSSAISYVDPTLSLEDHGASNSVVGLSVVIHLPDAAKTRIACANITGLAKSNSQDGDKKPGSSGTNLQVGGWLALTVFMASSMFL